MLINPVLLKLEKEVTVQTVLEVTDTGQLFACDFGIIGAEQFEEKHSGYERGRLVNTDHHAPTPKQIIQAKRMLLLTYYKR